MNREKRILNILSQVDEKYIEEAAPAMCQSTAKRSMRSGRRLSVVLAAALLALLLMGAGIVAAIYGDSIQSWFGHYWEAITGQSMSQEQTAVIDHLSQEIGASQTVGGVNVTVDSAVVGDDNFFLLLRVEGLDFSKRHSYGFDQVAMEVEPDPVGAAGGLGSFGFQFHGLDGDGAVLLLMDYSYSSGAGFLADTSPLKVVINLENLTRNAHTGRQKLLAEGQWNFTFSLDRSMTVEKIRLPDWEVKIMDLDMQTEVPVTLTNIELTCTGLRFQYVNQDGALSLGAHIYAMLDNGKRVNCGGGTGTPLLNSAMMNCSYQWMVPVNLDEVVAIEIERTQIPVG